MTRLTAVAVLSLTATLATRGSASGSQPAAPTPTPVEDPATGSGGGEGEIAYLGCFHDNQADRVLGHKLTSHDVTPTFCFDYCTELGAAFMATQWGVECWCSPDGGLDYNRHYDVVGEDAVCDMTCAGDESQTCGGFDSFDLYELAPPASTCSTPAEPYDQCGGLEWTGSTCCSDGYECTDMTSEGCYAQCRPMSTEETTPSPTTGTTTSPPVTTEPEVPPTPSPVAPESPPRVPAPTATPVAPETPSPVPAPTDPPVAPDTPSPVPAPTDPPVAPETPSPVPDTPEPTPARTPAPVTAEPVTPPSTPGTSAPAFFQELLDLHNELRCIHNANPLTWSSEVEASAMEQAKRMSDKCEGLDHSTREQRNNWGENIAYCGNGQFDGSCYSAERVMMDPEYGFYGSEVSTNDVTTYGGHATQILWKTSEKLGCAQSICASTGRTYLACQYDPAGNIGSRAGYVDFVDLPTNQGNC